MAPPTTTSTRAATIAHPAPASHHMTPNAAEYRRQREEHHYRVLPNHCEGTGRPDSIDFLAWHALQDAS